MAVVAFWMGFIAIKTAVQSIAKCFSNTEERKVSVDIQQGNLFSDKKEEVKEQGNNNACLDEINQKPPVSLKGFTFIKILGEGGFGTVFMAKQITTQENFAIKVVKKNVNDPSEKESLLTEKRVASLASRHPYLAGLLCSFQTANRLFFVMELCNCDLWDYIITEQGLDEEQCRFYAAELVLGIKFLHEHGIVHRDVKAENVLIDMQGHVKLADFGLAKEGLGYGKITRTVCGTTSHMAPEIVNNEPYGLSVDWWALGVLMYFMMIFEFPFSGNDVMRAIMSHEVFYPSFYISLEAVDILEGFLTKNWAERLGCTAHGVQSIMDHPFFRDIDWEKLEARQIEPPLKPEQKEESSDDDIDGPCNLSLISNNSSLCSKKNNGSSNWHEDYKGFTFVNPDFFKTNPIFL